MSLKHVMSPITINGVHLKNRIVRTAHGTGLAGAFDGITSDELIEYHRLRAEGGVALSVLEIVTIHPSAPGRLNGMDDRIIEAYQTLVDAVKPYDMRVLQQLWHGGAWSNPLDGSPPWAPSSIPAVMRGTVPIAMTKSQMQELTEGFVSAALRCVAGNLDGVEIHMAHSFLLQQFLSPLSNHRTDEYGGSFENRLRYPLEVLHAVRQAVGPNYLIAVRLSTEETLGGLDPEDNAKIASALQDTGEVDLLDLSVGGFYNFPKVIGAMHEPAGYMLSRVEPAAKIAKIPTLVTGRIRTLQEAEEIVASGVASLVGMTRAHIADPHLIQKTINGELDRVRPCIGANQCVQTIMSPTHNLTCATNAAVGAEGVYGDHKIVKTSKAKRVHIVGGGPTGLEAARVLALKGHSVVLSEAQRDLGGMARFAQKVPRHQAVGDIMDWLESEVYRLGVDVRLNTYVEKDDVIEDGAEAVIISTGSMPRMDGLQSRIPGQVVNGVEQPHVKSTVDILSAPNGSFSGSAVILDDIGHYEAIGVAEYLVEQGVKVAFVTPMPEFGRLLGNTLMTESALMRLNQNPDEFSLYTSAYLTEISKSGVDIAYLDNRQASSIDADIVVLATPNLSERSLYDELEEGFDGIRIIAGDAKSPRFLRNAIQDGNRAAWSID